MMTAPGAPPRPIRVVIVDDHPMLREGTRSVLTQHSGISVVGVAADGRAALELVNEHHPTVLLLDVHLPDISGVEVTRQVRSRHPEVAIVVLTGYDDAGYARALLRLGVRGYLGKAASADEIVAAVRAAAQGLTVIEPAALATFESTTEIFTARELEVLRLMVAGKRNAEIASNLDVSVKTVEFHVSNLLEKLNARSRTEAIVQAQQQGLVE
jgi:DNA-binding NarL/FixJ family response regulator